MAAPDPGLRGPDVYAIEQELADRRAGMSAGHFLIDLLFGIAAPAALLWFDAGLFRPIHGLAPALPPYWAKVAHVGAGCLIALLVLWGLTGARRPALGLLVAGPFAVGCLLSVALGYNLSTMALAATLHVSGLLALTPWATAYVFGRHALRALRAGAELSAPLAGVSLLLVGGIALGAVMIAGSARKSQVPLLLDQLLSRNEADALHAADRMAETRLYDGEQILIEYARLAKADPRRARVGNAYEMLTSEPLSLALRRAGVETDLPPQPGPPLEPPSPKDVP